MQENSSHGVVSSGLLTAHSGELIYDSVVCKVLLWIAAARWFWVHSFHQTWDKGPRMCDQKHGQTLLKILQMGNVYGTYMHLSITVTNKCWVATLWGFFPEKSCFRLVLHLDWAENDQKVLYRVMKGSCFQRIGVKLVFYLDQWINRQIIWHKLW